MSKSVKSKTKMLDKASPSKNAMPDMTMASALSRGSGMSSGNYCLAADNIFSMNEKVKTMDEKVQTMESE